MNMLHKKYDEQMLDKLCSAPDDMFFKLKHGKVTSNKFGRHWFFDRSSNVLAVAHVDTAIGESSLRSVNYKNGDILGFSEALDDRLGVYIIGMLLTEMGVMPDILFTEGEESGNSTAQDFVPPADKQYNWIFSFDRRGDDVVMYDYDTLARRELLVKHGFKPGIGTLSDICYLQHLNCTGFNFGCGYYREHTRMCHFVKSTMLAQVGKFISFYNANKNTHLAFDPSTVPTRSHIWQNAQWGNSIKHTGTWPDYPYAKPMRLPEPKVTDFPQVSYDSNTGVLWVLCPNCHTNCSDEDFDWHSSMCIACDYKSRSSYKSVGL